ncbi:MAG: hypothetical protein MZV63_69015 [Marinilabiliales bacterium]|nr:hypothetical protein [Marinilabiliales bacterium]
MTALLKDTWINVVYTYNAPTKVGTLYFNGEKMKSFDFNLWPTGDAKKGVTGLKVCRTSLRAKTLRSVSSRAGTTGQSPTNGLIIL